MYHDVETQFQKFITPRAKRYYVGSNVVLLCHNMLDTFGCKQVGSVTDHPPLSAYAWQQPWVHHVAAFDVILYNLLPGNAEQAVQITLF
jgi:hypothetical protein